MTQDSNSQLSMKQISGAAAMVMTTVAKTAGDVNQLTGQMNDLMVAAMTSSLTQALMGSAANVLGETLSGLTQFGSAYLNGNKGTNSLNSSKETTDLNNSINEAMRPEQSAQSQAFKNLQDQNGMNLIEGTPEQNIRRGSGELADENTQSNTRADMDYHKSKIDFLTQEKSIGADGIKSKYEGLNSQLDGFLGVATGFGLLSKALGSATQSVSGSVSQVLNQFAQSEQSAMKSANEILTGLYQTAGQLYAGNSMVRG